MESSFLDLVKSIESKEDIIRNPSTEELRELASHEEKTTEYESASYITKTRSRSAKFTEIVYEPNEEHEKILKEVKEYIQDKKLIAVDRVMCQRKDYQIVLKKRKK